MDNKLDLPKLNTLVETIVTGYREEQSEDLFKPVSQPKRGEIIKIILMMRELIFPEYFGHQQMINKVTKYYIGALLTRLYEKLYAEMMVVLENDSAGEQKGKVMDQTDEIICKFLGRIPALRNAIEMDVEAAFNGDPAAKNKDEIILAYPGLFAVSVYRMAHELHKLSVPLIPRIMTEYAHSITGIDIHPGAEIGRYFFIDHGTGIVVGETTTIGNNVKLYQGVTLGALSTREGQNLRGVKRHPSIEDDVTVYAGTSILGGNTVIGKGATIGSNVFLTRSVPAGTKVSVKVPRLMFQGEQFPENVYMDI